MEIWPWQEQTKRAMRKVFEENMEDWHRLTIDRDTEKENLGKKKKDELRGCFYHGFPWPIEIMK